MAPRGRPTGQASEARERLLDSASALFYREGIHSVGVDRVLDEAAVTRATMYRHFAGKEELVVAYLDREDSALRGYFAQAGAALAATGADDSPARLLELVIEGIADDVARNHTRGCPFINASAEYPDPASRVRVRVAEHRTWFRTTLRALLEASGHPDPETAASALVLLRDAAMVGGYLDGISSIRSAFVATARQAAGLVDA